MKADEIMAELNSLLHGFSESYGSKDENDLFELAVNDADFWAKYIGYSVSQFLTKKINEI